MSRCQHAQKITHFCITQSCTWKQSAGCQNCMKKYHNHIGKTKYIKQQEIIGIMEKLIVSSDAKAKCRHYQQALYNYFNNLKNQFSNCIDNLSKQMLNRVGTPFLYQKGYVGIYRRLKAREYRKISSKQLNPFLIFAKELQQDQLQSEQKRLYHQEAGQSFKIVRQLHEALNCINQVTKRYQVVFDQGKDFYNKIEEINKLRQALFSKPKENTKSENKQSNALQHKNQLINGLKSNMSQQTGTTKNPRSRKVSIDYSFQPIKPPQISKYDQNEKHISTQKQSLINMLNQKKKGQSPSKKSQQSQTQKKIQSNPQRTQNKSQSGIFLMKDVQKIPIQSSKQTLNSGLGQFKHSEQTKQPLKNNDSVEKQDNQQQKANLFDFLLAKGINFPQLVAHTILPQGKSSKKLYEQADVIKKKTIQIPMNPLPQQQQPSSPLLRKRKTNKQQQFSLGVKKVSDTIKKSNQVQNQQSLQNIRFDSNAFTKRIVRQEVKQQQSYHQIEDNQANSVALLIQSLHLQAEQAIPVLQAALRQCRTNLSAAEYLTYLYIQNGQAKECLSLCNEVLQRLEHSSQYQDLSGHLLNNKAAALNLIGRYSQSIVILEKIVATNPKDVFFKNLADAYFSIGIYEKAVFHYEQALKMNSNYDQAYYNLAVCLYIQQNYNNCKINIENALKISPQNQNYKQLMENLAGKISLTN